MESAADPSLTIVSTVQNYVLQINTEEKIFVPIAFADGVDLASIRRSNLSMSRIFFCFDVILKIFLQRKMRTEKKTE